MTDFNKTAEDTREQTIVRTSMIGIGANVVLAAFKAAVGLLSHSIAIVLDAVNNLSDALSSVITIVGTKLAGKKPDKKHPLGYGRIEYLSAMIVAAIVLYAGITSAVESFKKILEPETPDYSAVTLIIIAAAVGVKLLLGQYVKKVGEKVNSGALVASGEDARFDAILSFSVLVSAILYLLFGIQLEAWVGLVIAGFIIKAGVEMLMDTLDEILGKRVEREVMQEIRKTICEDPEVFGAYDLILHSYGPDKYVGSVHVEVRDTMTAEEIDVMERRIAGNVFLKHGIGLTGIGIYARNTKNDETARMRTEITKIAVGHKGVLQTHGFYVDPEKKEIHLDIIIDYDLEDRQETFRLIRKELESAYPGWNFLLTMDIDA